LTNKSLSSLHTTASFPKVCYEKLQGQSDYVRLPLSFHLRDSPAVYGLTPSVAYIVSFLQELLSVVLLPESFET